MVRLDTADRDQRVAALRERVRHQVLEFARLVASIGQATVAVIALRPQARAPQMSRQTVQRMDRRGAEKQGLAGEGFEVHAPILDNVCDG